MKKIIALCTVTALCFSGVALAKPGPNYGNGNGMMGDHMTQGRCAADNRDCPNNPNSPMGGFNGPNSTDSHMKNGGFDGPSMSISTVEQVANMKDDQKVALRGYIVQSLGDKEYLFKDDTGTIQVEIDHRRWKGQVITPTDLVEIQGEVDKDWKSTEIDVKRIIKVNTTKK